MLCAVRMATNTLRLLAPLLPRSKMPTTFSVSTAPFTVETRSGSPKATPRSEANSVPINIVSLPTSAEPCTILSRKGMMRKYRCGSMPTTDAERLASPRVIKAEPSTAGETTLTSGICWSCSITLCHWSMPWARCKGICTVAASRASCDEPGVMPKGKTRLLAASN